MSAQSKPSGRPIAPMTPEEFGRMVRDEDAKKRQHFPRRVTLTRMFGGFPVSVRADRCLDIAKSTYFGGANTLIEDYRPVMLWIDGEQGWHFFPCKRLTPSAQ